MRPYLVSFTIVLLLFFHHLPAQQPANDSLKAQQLDEVVVTAQYAPQFEKNTVYKVNIINTATIGQKSANNLRELLQHELNLNLSQSSVFGTGVALQGISKENIKILIDGVPVIGRLNGIIDLNQINLSGVERVEIIEGPVSVFYGTDAMGGVINLITKKKLNKTFEGSVAAYYESTNALNLNGNIGYKFGNNIILLKGAHYYFDGLSTTDAPRSLNWEKRRQSFGDISFIKKFDNINIRYSGGFSKEKLFSAGEPDSRGKISDEDYYTQRIDNVLNLQMRAGDKNFINATMSYLNYQRYHNTFNVDTHTFERVLLATDTKAQNITKFNYGKLKTQFGKSKSSDKFNYALGTDFYFESTKGSRILDEKQAIQTLAVFSSINYKLYDGLEIQPAARYTWNSVYGSLLSPSLNVKIKIRKHNQLRFSYARGFRAPSLKELFLDFHINAGPVTFVINGNEDLSVEKSHSFNLHFIFERSFDNLGHFTIEPSLFYNDIDNLIALSDMVNFTRNYMNIDKFKSLGGKIAVTNEPFEGLSLKAGFSLIGIFNKYNENFDSEKFLYTPEITSTIHYSMDKSKISFTVFYKYSGKKNGFYIDSSSGSLIKTKRNGFSNLDTFLSKSFFNNSLNVSIGAKNIFDVTDIETNNQIGEAHSRDLQLWGRSFFIKTKFNF